MAEKKIHDNEIIHEYAQAYEDIFGYSKTKIIENFPLNRLENVLKLSSISKTEHVKLCEDFLKNHINVKNFVGIWKISEEYKNQKLIYETKKFALNNFMRIVSDNDFLKVDSKILQEIIVSNDLKVPSEICVFNMLKRWGNIDKNRREDYCKLLRYIRFTQLPKKFFVENVMNELDLCETCAKIIKETASWYLDPETRPRLNFFSKDRGTSSQSLIHIPTDKFLKYKDLKVYNPSNASWIKLLDIESEIRYSCAVTMNEELILLGGQFCDNNVTNKGWRLDLRSKEYVPMISMSESRIFFAAAVFENQLFAFRGLDNDRKTIKSVEMWDSSTNAWKFVAPMVCERYHHAAVIHNDKIYIFGGYCDKRYLKSYEIYDPKTNEWELVPTGEDITCYDFCHIQATVLNDYIYVYECFKDSSLFEHHVKRFDPLTGRWSSLVDVPALQTCRHLVSYQMKVIFFGSQNNYEYDPVSEKWSEFSSQEIVELYDHVLCVPISNTNIFN